MLASTSARHYVLENDWVRSVLDDRGRIVSLINKTTVTELLNVPGLEDNWKLMVLGERHFVHYILGKDQTPDSCSEEEKDGTHSFSFHYEALYLNAKRYAIEVTFRVGLARDSREFHYSLDVVNRHDTRIREAWYPILGGFDGFEYEGERHFADLVCSGTDAKDVIRKGMPREEYIFCVEEETFRLCYPNSRMPWLDLYCGREGLYVGSHDKLCGFTDTRIEKYPPEKGWVADYIRFPEETVRWTRIMVGKSAEVDPGESWSFPPAVAAPHVGDWHAGADMYRAWTRTWHTRPERPQTLNDYVGWQHLLGMTYLGEIYFPFEKAADVAIEVNEKCGLNIVNYYGHEVMGSEGDGSSIAPAPELGGPEGFRRMCERLHDNGMKVIVFSHRHSLISMEDREYVRYEPWAIKDKYGRPRQEVWWKTTIESMTAYGAGAHYEGNGPISVPICPHCDEWWETCYDEIASLIELGLDGIQLDLLALTPMFCYADNHGHKPGAMPMERYFEQLAALRAKLKALKPDFLLCGEECPDVYFQFVDLPYSRYRNNSGYEVFHYTFPEVIENAAVDAYAYDQANKALLLGYGLNTEMWVLKKSLLDVGPEFMDYLGGIVRLKRKYPEYLIRGTFVDTLRASVTGGVKYGVHEGPDGLAVVLWNNGNAAAACTVQFADDSLRDFVVCVPGEPELELSQPNCITVQPHRTAVVIARRRLANQKGSLT